MRTIRPSIMAWLRQTMPPSMKSVPHSARYWKLIIEHSAGRPQPLYPRPEIADNSRIMIRKRVSKQPLHDPAAPRRDRDYWLSRSPEERIAAVELLRRQRHGSSARLQRVARVVQRARR